MTMCSVIWIVAVLHFGCVISQNIRLIPGPDKGRLEVLYNGTWGTVCQSNFYNTAASVVCRSLNQSFNNAYWVLGQEYGAGSLKPRLSQVSCNGRETSLFDCSLTGRTDTSRSCSTSYIVGIVCTDEKIQAFFYYGGNWFSSAQTLNVFEGESVSCYGGNNTYVKSFRLQITQGSTVRTSRSDYAYYRPQLSDKRPFTCTVSNWQMPNQDSLTMDMNLMYPPLDFVTSEIKVMEGTTINISLANMPNPIPYLTTWHKTGTRLKWNQTEAYRMYRNISRADGGVFLVNISTEMNSSRNLVRRAHGLELITINVQYQPTVKCEKEHIVSEGSKVNITCEVEANPPPHLYIWTDSSGNIIYRGSNPSLVIESVRSDNVGRYKCTAINQMEVTKGNIMAGLGLAELSIILERDHSPSTTQSPSQTSSTFMYAMVAVIVVSLVTILVLVVVIVKLRRNRAPEEPNARMTDTTNGRHPEHHNEVFTESDYTTLDYANTSKK